MADGEHERRAAHDDLLVRHRGTLLVQKGQEPFGTVWRDDLPDLSFHPRMGNRPKALRNEDGQLFPRGRLKKPPDKICHIYPPQPGARRAVAVQQREVDLLDAAQENGKGQSKAGGPDPVKQEAWNLAMGDGRWASTALHRTRSC